MADRYKRGTLALTEDLGLGVGIPLVATVAYFAHKRLRTGTRASTALDVADVLLGGSK